MWGFPKKPTNPLTARERELEAELKRLKSKVERLAREEPVPAPPARETPLNPAATPRTFSRSISPGKPPPKEPVTTVPAPINELGSRKYDLLGAWRRLMNQVRGPTANNPRMARMLAAGSIHGLRPLRYERRVARNRFIALFVILLLILWGLGYTYMRNR
ncbi:MAG: hypothetical protein JNL10_12855 [Verrucomicrobiales bacterium]|nr:hypothetical protein [Verrucomicrobiales bacterium]